jgi:hypothetical protein
MSLVLKWIGLYSTIDLPFVYTKETKSVIQKLQAVMFTAINDTCSFSESA